MINDTTQMPEKAQDQKKNKNNGSFRHLGYHVFLIALVAALLFVCIPCACASSLKGPWEKKESPQAFQKQINRGFSPLWLMVRAYRTYISPIDGKNCPMHPTCSEYSLQCLKEHGPIIGWVMTCDRLFRCGRDELRLSPEIILNDELRCLDPLENNDFWWYNGH
jgi:putative membrane protein insertion efficiency factor